MASKYWSAGILGSALALMLMGCGPMEFTPWGSKAPASDLTAKNIQRLSLLDQSPTGQMTVAIIGDPQRNPEDLASVVDLINDIPDVDFTVLAGDITDMGLQREFEWAMKAIRRLNKPVLTVVGNHDGIGKGKTLYQETFGPLNYDFTFRGVRFVMWNNNPLEWSVNSDWLEDEFKVSLPSVVVAHQPPDGTSLNADQQARWATVRQSPGMLASIHGHLHLFALHTDRAGGPPIYTVDRVAGRHYGLMRITQGKAAFWNCSPDCQEVHL